MDPQLKERIDQAGQSHLLDGWDSLKGDQRSFFQAQLETIDFQYVNKIFKSSISSSNDAARPSEPVNDVMTLTASSDEQRQSWRTIGLKMIAEGKLGALLLAGGQGTRLGSSDPKGCYDIGLPSHKSLFQLQAERILKIQQLAREKHPQQHDKPLRWYIMTSHATDELTKAFFHKHNYFGLQQHQIFFFSQGMLPALTEDGKIILESPGKVAMAPDGNGGLYMALQSSGALSDMEAHGVEAVDCFSVDNALVRVGDPVFAGFCKERGVECGARVVAKAYPEEKVGVFARRNNRLQVVEYSELDPAEASAFDSETGVLRYNWSNVCLHFFQREWLDAMASRLRDEGIYHIARKQIPSFNGKVPGIKLELFIFDAFPMADVTALMQIKREEEFAPVKNAPGSTSDSPDTARAAILALHTSWVTAAGGLLEDESSLVEVSPAVSYAGEGLNGLTKGRTFRSLEHYIGTTAAVAGSTTHPARENGGCA